MAVAGKRVAVLVEDRLEAVQLTGPVQTLREAGIAVTPFFATAIPRALER